MTSVSCGKKLTSLSRVASPIATRTVISSFEEVVVVGNGLATGNLARVVAKAPAQSGSGRNISPTCTDKLTSVSSGTQISEHASQLTWALSVTVESCRRAGGTSIEIGNKTSPSYP